MSVASKILESFDSVQVSHLHRGAVRVVTPDIAPRYNELERLHGLRKISDYAYEAELDQLFGTADRKFVIVTKNHNGFCYYWDGNDFDQLRSAKVYPDLESANKELHSVYPIHGYTDPTVISDPITR